MLRISEFAALCGITATTLRHYERIGLFRPAWTDQATGYRYYAPSQLPEIHRVIALRDLGVPLQQIRQLVHGGIDLSEVLERRRWELESQRRLIAQRLAAIDISFQPAASHGVVVRTLAADLVVSCRRWISRIDDPAPIFDDVERYVQSL
ncbi:MAG: helix-turn-helix domain-containing protein, partial [Ilumatobacteraceae bacterium]